MGKLWKPTSAKLPPLFIQGLDQVRDIFFLRFEHRFDVSELLLELDVLLVVHDLWRFADDGLEEFLFRDLLEVGETEFGKEFLQFSSARELIDFVR